MHWLSLLTLCTGKYPRVKHKTCSTTYKASYISWSINVVKNIYIEYKFTKIVNCKIMVDIRLTLKEASEGMLRNKLWLFIDRIYRMVHVYIINGNHSIKNFFPIVFLRSLNSSTLYKYHKTRQVYTSINWKNYAVWDVWKKMTPFRHKKVICPLVDFLNNSIISIGILHNWIKLIDWC